jgi:hypothetical protein
MSSPRALCRRGCGAQLDRCADRSGSYKPELQSNGMGRPTIAGDSPVDEEAEAPWIGYPSTAGHVESRGNLGGPPPKTKYSLATDSEPVP